MRTEKPELLLSSFPSMSNLVQRNFDFFKKLCSNDPKDLELVIISATEDNINALTELVFNLLNGNLKIDDKTKSQLKKYKIFLRNLSDTQITYKRKKKSIFRKRKILGCILSPILAILSSCIGKLVAESC